MGVKPPPINVTTVTDVVQIVVHLSPGQAHALYNDIYVVLRENGIMSAEDRHKFTLPALYSLYDGLYAADIDGSGPS